jgi:hypothetical protein
MAEPSAVNPIVVYIVERHPLEDPLAGAGFAWLDPQGGSQRLEGLIGAHDPSQVSYLVDESPGGPAWKELLDALLQERLRMVITHLAPLTPAQRQQLIGVCAQTGTRLITPSDAGRNRTLSTEPKTRPRRKPGGIEGGP